MRALVVCLTLWIVATQATAQTVVIATTGTFPPYLYEETDPLEGLDIDLMDEICRRNGFDCQYEIYALQPGLEAIANGRADVALGGIGIIAEREVYGYFTCPYRAGSAVNVPIFAPDPSVEIQTARIAVLGSSLGQRALEAQGLTPVPFDSLAGAIQSVLDGETEAYWGNPNSLGLVAGAANRLEIVGYVPSQSGGSGFLVTASKPWLLNRIDSSLRDFQRDGTLRGIGEAWFGPGNFAEPDGMDCTFLSAGLAP